MGAFFAYKDKSDICVSDVERVFRCKGFSEPKTFTMNEWRLMLYPKIGIQLKNYLVDDSVWLFVCGTVVYKGLGYADSLQKIRNDYRTNSLDQEALLGHFCLIFFDHNEVKLLTDRMNSFHVFTNENHNCISSSFLATLAASPSPLPLNRLAICEKISTGYIISPDTLVNGINQINADVANTFSLAKDAIEFLPHPRRRSLKLHCRGRQDSLDRQVDQLERHFEAFNNLHLECTGDLGLSEGYDSRLLFACGRFLSKPLTLHTHATNGAHGRSQRIAAVLAEQTQQPLTIVRTQMLNELSEVRIAELFREGLYLFDGRNAHSVGVAGETQTRNYKLRSLGPSRLSFNGLSGEMYRNHYNTRRWGKFSANAWMQCHDIFPFAREVAGERALFEAMMSHRLDKIHKRLGSDSNEKVDFLWTRRFYSEIRTPDCDCNNSNAINQLMFYNSPFSDQTLIREALNATPYIGIGGSYQGDLIGLLNPELVKIPINNGDRLDRPLGWRKTARSLASEHYPLKLLRKSRYQRIVRHHKSAAFNSEGAMLSLQPYRDSVEMLMESDVVRSIDKLMYHYAQGPNAIYVGNFMREFQRKIKWN